MATESGPGAGIEGLDDPLNSLPPAIASALKSTDREKVQTAVDSLAQWAGDEPARVFLAVKTIRGMTSSGNLIFLHNGNVDIGPVLKKLTARPEVVSSSRSSTTTTTAQPKAPSEAASASGAVAEDSFHQDGPATSSSPAPASGSSGVWDSANVLDYGQQVAQHFGLKINSHERTPEKNAAENGAKNSDHLWGGALDFGGTPAQLDAFAAWARQYEGGADSPFRLVLWQTKGHYDHVHLSFKKNSPAVAPLPEGGGYTPTGEITEHGPGPSASSPTSAGSLQRGSKGPAVTELQQKLADAGFDPGPIDGLFGQKTEAALKAYQTANGMTVDGVSGPQTATSLGLAGGTVDGGDLSSYIGNTYPQMLWAVNHPELGPILSEAADGEWDTARLYGRLIQTNWWKENPGSARTLANLKANDPATWSQMLDQQNARIQDASQALGWVNLPAERLAGISARALEEGWNDSQLQDALIDAMPVDLNSLEQGQGTGQLASFKRQLDSVANSHLVSLSDADKKTWLRRLVKGEVSLDAFVEYSQSIAGSQMPWMADSIQRGITPEQFVAPYRQWIAQTMETTPDQIDFTQAKYRDVVYDSKNANVRTLPEVEQYVRKNFDGWDRTRQANESYSAVNESLLKTFGKVG